MASRSAGASAAAITASTATIGTDQRASLRTPEPSATATMPTMPAPTASSDSV
ncbi:hypothetical protein D9M72_449850 [compost metagenome]